MTEIDEASLPSRRRRALTSPRGGQSRLHLCSTFFFRGKSGRKLRLYPANPAGDSGAGMRGDCEIIIGTQWSNSVCPSRPRDWCVMLGRRLPASPACVRRNSRNKNFPSLAHSRLLRLCRPPPLPPSSSPSEARQCVIVTAVLRQVSAVWGGAGKEGRGSSFEGLLSPPTPVQKPSLLPWRKLNGWSIPVLRCD